VALNFGRYLDRLGVRGAGFGRQPALLDTVQPVLLVGDVSGIVPKPWPRSYMIGTHKQAGGAAYASVLVQTPQQLWIRQANLSGESNVACVFNTGLAGVAAPVLANTIPMVPQLLDAEADIEALWLSGEVGAPDPNTLADLPTLKLTTNSSTVNVFDIMVPAGGWLQIRWALLGLTSAAWFLVSELPSETPG
jgi:hypothetical protein